MPPWHQHIIQLFPKFVEKQRVTVGTHHFDIIHKVYKYMVTMRI